VTTRPEVDGGTTSSVSRVTGFVTEPVTVRVPATSANLGAGFDSLGLALSLHDEVTAQVTFDDTEVTIEGQGADTLPTDESHLVVTSLHRACQALGAPAPRVKLHCRNGIPQARGLGSSSAAIVAGVSLAAALLADTTDTTDGAGDNTVDDAVLLRIAAELEGHPDNVAPCLLGGFTIAWTESDGARAVRLPVAEDVSPVVYLPSGRGLTTHARAALPGRIPHVDAAFNISRAALAVHALTADPSLLMAATADRIHQHYRADVMPSTIELVERLRRDGVPAVVSGAGPSVLAFDQLIRPVDGFEAFRLSVADGVTRL